MQGNPILRITQLYYSRSSLIQHVRKCSRAGLVILLDYRISIILTGTPKINNFR